MKSTLFLGVCTASIFLAGGAAQATGTWEMHTAELVSYRVKVGKEHKTVTPSCALGDPYTFYLKPGKTDKLLVYFNGGGACWDNNTCVDSLITNNPVYATSSTDSFNNPGLMDGILDVDNPDNPYAAWSMLFIS
jgi:hypothetical protein